jgi:Membrane protein involved in the export of O-antigen and teichoic acid
VDNLKGSRIIKNSALNLFNTFFMLATSWVISIWVARQLGPSNYGIFNLVLWLTDSFTWVIGMGLIHAITKFIAEYHGRNENECLGVIVVFVLKIELVFSLITMGILIWLRAPIAHYFFTPKQSIYFLIAFFGILPGITTAILSAAIDGIQKFEYFTYANLIISPLSFISKIIVLMLGKGIIGLLIVMLVFSFVNVLFYVFVLKKEGVLRASSLTTKIDTTLKKRIMKYNRSVIAILICDKIVWDKSENFFLGRLCTSVEVAYYNLGFNIAQKIVSVLPLTFWRVLFPAMSNFFGSGNSDKMKRLFFLSTRYLAFAVIPTGVAGIILAYPIIHFLYGHDYIGAQRVLQMIFLSSIVSSMANPAAAILYGYEKQAFIYKFGFFLALFNITLDILVIKRYGAFGAAIAYTITTFFASVVGLIYTCRTMKLSYPFVSIFKVVFSTVIMGIVMEIIILHNREIFGFIASIICGMTVYFVSALVLGTFEKEDFLLLENLSRVLPKKSEKLLGGIIAFIGHFKPGREDDKSM